MGRLRMPSLATFRLTDRYRDRLRLIVERAQAHALATWPREADYADSDWPQTMAVALGQAQRQAVSASAAYLSAVLTAETGRSARAPALPREGLVGVAPSGAPLERSLLAPINAQRAAQNAGQASWEAERVGQRRAGQLVEAFVMRSARESLRRGLELDERVVGWRRAVRGTCSACLGVIEDEVPTERPETEMNIHPNCQCVTEPVVDEGFISEQARRHRRASGSERFRNLSANAQDDAIGTEAAYAVRKGFAKLRDFVTFRRVSDAESAYVQKMLVQRRVRRVLSGTDKKIVEGAAKRRARAKKAARTRAENRRREATRRVAAAKREARRDNDAPKPQDVETGRDDITLSTGQLDDPAPLGGGINSTVTAKLPDGRRVVVKGRELFEGQAGLIRRNIDDGSGMEHSVAAARIAEFLRMPTPKIVTRRGEAVKAASDLVRSLSRSGGRHRVIGDRVSVQTWTEGFTDGMSVPVPTATRVEAHRMTTLDYIIGNTDRHPGNFGYAQGRLHAIDHDLSFPTGPTSGNLMTWTEGGQPIYGKPLEQSVRARVERMIADEDDWRAALKQDGLSDEKIDAMYERIHQIADNGYVVPRPLDANITGHSWSGNVVSS